MNCLYSHIVLFFQLIEWGGPTLINGTISFWSLLFPLSQIVQEPKGFIQSHRISSPSRHQMHSWVICILVAPFLLGSVIVLLLMMVSHVAEGSFSAVIMSYSSFTRQMFLVITYYVPGRVLCYSGTTEMTKKSRLPLYGAYIQVGKADGKQGSQ